MLAGEGGRGGKEDEMGEDGRGKRRRFRHELDWRAGGFMERDKLVSLMESLYSPVGCLGAYPSSPPSALILTSFPQRTASTQSPSPRCQ